MKTDWRSPSRWINFTYYVHDTRWNIRTEKALALSSKIAARVLSKSLRGTKWDTPDQEIKVMWECLETGQRTFETFTKEDL